MNKSDPLGLNARKEAAAARAAGTPAPEEKKESAPVPANTAGTPAPQSSGTPAPSAPAPAGNSGSAGSAPSGKDKQVSAGGVINLVTMSNYCCDKDTLSKDVKAALSGEKASEKLIATVAHIQKAHGDKLQPADSVTDAMIVASVRFANKADDLSDDFLNALSGSDLTGRLIQLIQVLNAKNEKFGTQVTGALKVKHHIEMLYFGTECNKWYESSDRRKQEGNTDTTGPQGVWLTDDFRFVCKATLEEQRAELAKVTGLQAEIDKLTKENADLKKASGSK